MPYPRRLLWDVLPRNTPNSQNLLLRRASHGFHRSAQMLGCAVLPQNSQNSQNLLLRCPPTDFTDLHRYLGCAVLPQNSQNSQNLAAWVWQGCHTLLICEHPCHLWEALLCQKFLCVPCVLWESLSSHGFLLRRVLHLAIPTPPAMGYSPTEYAEFTEPPAEMSSHGFHSKFAEEYDAVA